MSKTRDQIAATLAQRLPCLKCARTTACRCHVKDAPPAHERRADAIWAIVRPKLHDLRDRLHKQVDRAEKAEDEAAKLQAAIDRVRALHHLIEWTSLGDVCRKHHWFRIVEPNPETIAVADVCPDCQPRRSMGCVCAEDPCPVLVALDPPEKPAPCQTITDLDGATAQGAEPKPTAQTCLACGTAYPGTATTLCPNWDCAASHPEVTP